MNDYPAISAIRAALGCRCPRCGQGRLFAGLLSVRGACEVCGLDLSGQDAGDGPAVFVILFLGLDRGSARGFGRGEILAVDLDTSRLVDAVHHRRRDCDVATAESRPYRAAISSPSLGRAASLLKL